MVLIMSISVKPPSNLSPYSYIIIIILGKQLKLLANI